MKWSLGVGWTVVVQGERNQWRLAIRTEDTGHVGKLCVKTLFISENFHSKFRSFLCIVRNFYLQDVVHGQFDKTGVYAGHCFIIRLPRGGQCPLVRDSEPIRLLEMPTSPSLYMLIYYIILYCIILYYIVLYYVMSCHVKLYYITLYYIILYYIMSCHVKLYYIILYYIMLCYVMLCYVMLCYVMLCYVILYYIILYYNVLY